MRTSRLADALFPRTRQRILAATLLHPMRAWYVRALARHLGLRASTLQRELARLVEVGILKKWQDGGRVYIQADESCPVHGELRLLMIKTAGIVDVLREALRPFRSKIKAAFVFGSIAEGNETAPSDVDLMIVGSVGMMELVPGLERVTGRLLRQVNPVIYTLAEFGKRQRESRFVQRVLGSPQLFVIGTKDDLGGTAAGKTGGQGAQRSRRN